MDQASVIADNRRELTRLKELLASLKEDQFGISLGGGWTVGAALGHLAFWDQRAIVLLERWEKEGVGASGADSDALNRAILPFWLALPGRTAADLALKAAE